MKTIFKTIPFLFLASSSLGQETYSNATSYVPDIRNCPSLPPRSSPPTSVHDLRPDDFKVVMAMGDSLTAAFGAHPYTGDILEFVKNLFEDRGVSFSIGADPGALTIPNLLSRYQPNLVGGSKGSHFIHYCSGSFCPPLQYRMEKDQGNAAQSGAIAANLPGQIKYLERYLSEHESVDAEKDWKLLHLVIGGNDICSVCDDQYNKFKLDPDTYEQRIRSTLENIKATFPRTVVNLVGLFDIHGITRMTKSDHWCTKIRSLLPRLKQECTCALLPEPLGSVTRKKMHEMNDEYNRRLVKIASDFQKTQDQNFAVILETGLMKMKIEEWPLSFVTNIDCFHPSEMAHRFIASVLWEGLFLPSSAKKRNIDFNKPLHVYCPTPNDRIQTR